VSTAVLNTINATIRELLDALDELRRGRRDRRAVLKLVDELENQIDSMISQLAPERITDERFEAAMKAIREVSEKVRKLREYIIGGKTKRARSALLEVQESVRFAYRLLTLIRAGAPTTVIFQVAPQFLREVEVSAPESLVYANPMAGQIYNILLRKGEATVEELAAELRVDDRTRDEFNRAIAYLISSGYARPYFTPDNRMVLRPTKR